MGLKGDLSPLVSLNKTTKQSRKKHQNRIQNKGNFVLLSTRPPIHHPWVHFLRFMPIFHSCARSIVHPAQHHPIVCNHRAIDPPLNPLNKSCLRGRKGEAGRGGKGKPRSGGRGIWRGGGARDQNDDYHGDDNVSGPKVQMYCLPN